MPSLLPLNISLFSQLTLISVSKLAGRKEELHISLRSWPHTCELYLRLQATADPLSSSVESMQVGRTSLSDSREAALQEERLHLLWQAWPFPCQFSTKGCS